MSMQVVNKLNKIKNIKLITFIIVLSIVIYIFCGCNDNTSTDDYSDDLTYEIDDSYRYEFEITTAKIIHLDTKRWYYAFHRYNWDIKVYCEKYKTMYQEDGHDEGMFADVPEYFDKSVGDTVKVKIEKRYKDNEFYDARITEIIED